MHRKIRALGLDLALLASLPFRGKAKQPVDQKCTMPITFLVYTVIFQLDNPFTERFDHNYIAYQNFIKLRLKGNNPIK